MTLISKSVAERDRRQRFPSLAKLLHRAFDPTLANILTNRRAKPPPERSGQRHGVDSDCLSDAAQGQWSGDLVLDETASTLEPPRYQSVSPGAMPGLECEQLEHQPFDHERRRIIHPTELAMNPESDFSQWSSMAMHPLSENGSVRFPELEAIGLDLDHETPGCTSIEVIVVAFARGHELEGGGNAERRGSGATFDESAIEHEADRGPLVRMPRKMAPGRMNGFGKGKPRDFDSPESAGLTRFMFG